MPDFVTIIHFNHGDEGKMVRYGLCTQITTHIINHHHHQQQFERQAWLQLLHLKAYLASELSIPS